MVSEFRQNRSETKKVWLLACSSKRGGCQGQKVLENIEDDHRKCRHDVDQADGDTDSRQLDIINVEVAQRKTPEKDTLERSTLSLEMIPGRICGKIMTTYASEAKNYITW